MTPARSARRLALGILVLTCLSSPILADDTWEGRLLRRIETLEKRLEELDGGSARAAASITDRVRSLDTRVSALERSAGIAPKEESYYSGTEQSGMLLSLTTVVVSLMRRIAALPSGDAHDTIASSSQRAAAEFLWGGDRDVERVARTVHGLHRRDVGEFIAAVRAAVEQGPPQAYIAEEQLRLEVADWATRLRDPSTENAVQAALELGYSQHPNAVDPLLDATRNATHLRVRVQAVDALQMVGRLDAIPHLIELITDSSELVGSLAEAAVEHLIANTEGRKPYSGPTSSRVYVNQETLRENYHEGYVVPRSVPQRFYRDYFGRHEGELRRRSGQSTRSREHPGKPAPVPAALAQVVRMILEREAPAVPRPEEEVEALELRSLRELLWAVRAEVHARRLAGATEHPKPWDRSEGTWVRIWIARVHRPEADLAWPAVSKLADIGSPACITNLVWALREHPDADVRLVAALCLGRIHAVDTIPALIDAVCDEDETVRSAACVALDYYWMGVRPRYPETTLKAKPGGREAQRIYRRWFKANEKRLRSERADSSR